MTETSNDENLPAPPPVVDQVLVAAEADTKAPEPPEGPAESELAPDFLASSELWEPENWQGGTIRIGAAKIAFTGPPLFIGGGVAVKATGAKPKWWPNHKVNGMEAAP